MKVADLDKIGCFIAVPKQELCCPVMTIVGGPQGEGAGAQEAQRIEAARAVLCAQVSALYINGVMS